MIKKDKNNAKVIIFLKKILLLFAIYGFMIIGPVIFTFVYYIQAARFQEKALMEIKLEEKRQNLVPNIVFRREE